MAFQQPQRAVPRRSVQVSTPPPIETQAIKKKAAPEESQEWVLFSPELTTTESTCTAGLSRHSDYGSLDTAAVSERLRPHHDQLDGNDVDDTNDTEDLDSLDDGLHAFGGPSPNSAPRRQSQTHHQTTDIAATVLPTHDGFGGFPGDSSPVQDQFWQHERHNPRRRRQSIRRSSLQRNFDLLDSDDLCGKDDRNQRIENWRTEQSRAIIEEIEIEKRRQRKRRNQLRSSHQRSRSQLSASELINDPLKGTSEAQIQASNDPSSSSEPFWTRFTRRVIRDIMGIDDVTLSYIFGESFAPGATSSVLSHSEMIEHANRVVLDEFQTARNSDIWEDRFLARIAKEIGVLVHRLSEHPGAFSTYLKTQEVPPYAGLPTPAHLSQPSTSLGNRTRPDVPSTPQFAPTLKYHRRLSSTTADPSLWGIEEEHEAQRLDTNLTPTPSHDPAAEQAARLRAECEYWERDLDVKLVFGFLRDRLSPSRSSTPTPTLNPNHNRPAPPAPSDSLRRAALIRHHHPLVSRNFTAQSGVSSAVALGMDAPLATTPISPVLGRRSSYFDDEDALGSSCASQSTKKSKTVHSGSLGSSRNFWDIGGSGAGSVGWGEV